MNHRIASHRIARKYTSRCYRNKNRRRHSAGLFLVIVPEARTGARKVQYSTVLCCTSTVLYLWGAFVPFLDDSALSATKHPLVRSPRRILINWCPVLYRLFVTPFWHHVSTLLCCLFSFSLFYPFRSFLLTNTALRAQFYILHSGSPEPTSSSSFPFSPPRLTPPSLF